MTACKYCEPEFEFVCPYHEGYRDGQDSLCDEIERLRNTLERIHSLIEGQESQTPVGVVIRDVNEIAQNELYR